MRVFRKCGSLMIVFLMANSACVDEKQEPPSDVEVVPPDDTACDLQFFYVDADGDFVPQGVRPARQFIGNDELLDETAKWQTQAEIQALYAGEPVSVGEFDSWLDHQVEISSLAMAANRRDDLVSQMNEDSIRSHIADVSALYDPEYLGEALLERAQQSKVAMAVGATRVDNHGCELFAEVADRICQAEAALHAVSLGKTGGVSPTLLSKIWRIPIEQAEKTLGVTTQLNRQDADSSLARNFGTNDRMLRYKRIKSHFFTDTFFVTGKAKSTRGNTCMQLFVSDKGFVAVYPMVAVKEYIHALRQFAKGVGAPEVLVADPHPTQKKKEVKDNKKCKKKAVRIVRVMFRKRQITKIRVGIRRGRNEKHQNKIMWLQTAP